MQPITSILPADLAIESGLSDDKRRWVAKAIAGAILADGKIHEKERRFLEAFSNQFSEDVRLIEYIAEYLGDYGNDPLDQIDVPQKLRLKLFKTILDICACDLDLDIKEIYFINNFTNALGITIDNKQKMVTDAVYDVKDSLFKRIVENLDRQELYWLVNNALKVLFHSSHHFVDNEIPYAMHFTELIKDYNLFDYVADELGEEKVTSGLSDKTLLDEDLRMSVIKFLLELTMCDGVWSGEELDIIRAVARQYGIDQEQLEWQIYCVKSGYDLLFKQNPDDLISN